MPASLSSPSGPVVTADSTYHHVRGLVSWVFACDGTTRVLAGAVVERSFRRARRAD